MSDEGWIRRDPTKHEVVNAHGYLISWAKGPRGVYYNAYSPHGKHIDSGYDKEIVKALCELHRDKLEKQRADYRAKKLERA
jgi:hypothetical protein